MKTLSQRLSALLWAVLLLAAVPATGWAKNVSTAIDTYEPWEDATVDVFRGMLVQEGGRVKPIDTLARYKLLQYSGLTSIKFETAQGEAHKLDAATWMMDVLFRTELAKEMPLFIVDDSTAVVAINVVPKEKRDRYSYNDLLRGREKLANLSAEYAQKDAKDRNRTEQNLVNLGQNVSDFEYLSEQFSFADPGALASNSVLPEEMKQMAQKFDAVEFIDQLPEMPFQNFVQSMQQMADGTPEEQMVADGFRLVFFYASTGRKLNIFPPAEEENEEWLSVGTALIAAIESEEKRPWVAEQLNGLKELVQASNSGDEASFLASLKDYTGNIKQEAKARGEGAKAGLEVSLYQGNYFLNSLAFFVVAFVFLAVSWLEPGGKFGRYMTWAAIGACAIGLGYDVAGIVIRCIIRGRPPITGLYDTIIFITAVAVLLGLFIEWADRKRVGIAAAVICGMAGMFLSLRYDMKEATDTMPQLQAVLDTNFWLATHVTIINIGYAAGILAGVIAHFYLLGRPIAILMDRDKEKKPREMFRSVTRKVYGVTCFCLLFSLVGTVLGGIWANYSWGRFWGWDPKENGALLICLWSLVMLHARMGGYFREVGTNVAAVVLGMIVTFSWWGVNNLGVGLHSYGFTEGVWGALYTFWAVEGIFLGLGLFLFIHDRMSKVKKQGAPEGKEMPTGGKAEPA